MKSALLVVISLMLARAADAAVPVERLNTWQPCDQDTHVDILRKEDSYGGTVQGSEEVDGRINGRVFHGTYQYLSGGGTANPEDWVPAFAGDYELWMNEGPHHSPNEFFETDYFRKATVLQFYNTEGRLSGCSTPKKNVSVVLIPEGSK